jgi:hypothetical protein
MMYVIVYTSDNDGTPSVVGPFYSSNAASRYDTTHPQDAGVFAFILPLERRAETLAEQRERED